MVPYYTKVYRCVKSGARHFFQAIQDLKRLFVKATLVSNDPGARHFFQAIQRLKWLFVKATSGLKTAQVPGT
jgi:hypothetical protein